MPDPSGAEALIPSVPPLAVADQCKIPDPIPRYFPIDSAMDVEYAVLGGQREHLDVYWPGGDRTHPLLLFIHPGSWVSGDRMAFTGYLQLLTQRGYATASVDYRLADGKGNVFPAPIADVRCAVRFLRGHAKRFHIDATRIAAVGTSAGGHLAAMLGVAADSPWLDGDCPYHASSPAVSAVMAFYAPFDLRDPHALGGSVLSGVMAMLGGANPAQDTLRARLISPIAYLKPGGKYPPFFLAHGTADYIVSPEQSRRMYDALRAAGVSATYVELPGVGHLFPAFDWQSDARATWMAATCTAFDFANATLHPDIEGDPVGGDP